MIVEFTYHFRVTVNLTMTSDPGSRITVSGAYLLHYLIGISNWVCGCILGQGSVA